MGLNLSNNQISKELDLNRGDVHNMATQLREGVVKKKPQITLQDEVECDEVYIVAGHKGNPEAVSKKGRDGRRNRLKGARGRGTLEKRSHLFRDDTTVWAGCDSNAPQCPAGHH